MLSALIFLPLAMGLLILLLPASRPRLVRWIALATAGAVLGLSLILWIGYDAGVGGLQWRTTAAWIPGLGAAYDVAVDGISLPLIVLTGVLLFASFVHVLHQDDRARTHAFLFLLMATGLIGLFAAQDLLLFYLFFEVGLVPMYFIIGAFGGAGRRYAALKFFLYTRAASLAILLAFFGLYLSMTPHTFSLEEIVRAQPLAGALPSAGLVLLGLVLGFGVKLPTVPLHNWLPDAHVEAPTEGSVMLAGVQLKMGAYGLIRIVLPTVPEAVRTWAWVLVGLGLVSLVYGALAALAQKDLKRLVAYTSVNHMGWVMLAAGVWGMTTDPALRALAVTGAVYQMVSHGLLTGGMFFMAGILQDQAGTRDLPRFGGLGRQMPLWAFALGLLAFASLGLPGFSGFIAELQVIGATVSQSVWAAGVAVLALIVTTGLYLRIVSKLVLGEAPEAMPPVHEPPARELAVVYGLAGLSLFLGVLPAVLVGTIQGAARALGGG